MTEIINRVSKSPIKTINLEEIYPAEERVGFDLKEYLFQELILREKEFRQALKDLNWQQYDRKWVSIYCSADAIVPTWAYMLVASYLESVSKGFVVGNMRDLEIHIVDQLIDSLEVEEFRDRPIVIKGCSSIDVPLYAYGKLVSKLQPFAKNLMFGEPCSTVPIYKKPKS